MSKYLVIKELIETIKVYNLKGWSPATSTNYSFIDENKQMWISRSGIDKRLISENDFIPIDINGHVIGGELAFNPSAETLIHTSIYKLFPEANVILHSHGLYPVLLSSINKNYFEFEGIELQKGFDGVDSHLLTVKIPIFENSQDMFFFEKQLFSRKSELIHHCFVISKHGIYAWGNNLFEAKRHLETLDYLCQFEWFLNK
jgi:methylthioribulose-1-phosphate dehydratase